MRLAQLVLVPSLMAALASPIVAQAPRVPIELPECAPGTSVEFSHTGIRQAYDIPVGAEAVFIEAYGASGGNTGFPGNDPAQLEKGIYYGGMGASMVVEIPVTGSGTLDVVVGGMGATGIEQILGPQEPEPEKPEVNGAGGGGGSFVSISGGTTLLVAAGGGGGAGITEDGSDASLSEDGGDGGGTCGGAGGTGGNGGEASDTPEGADRGEECSITKGRGGGAAGGGGGWLTAGGDGDAEGGDRVSPPGTAEGGNGIIEEDGGFGGGGGGSDVGGGGGGGYSGGGGGYGPDVDGAGGGGSFAAKAANVIFSSVNNVGDGSVFICSIGENIEGGGDSFTPAIPIGGPWAKAGLTGLLAMVALLVLRRLS